MPIPNTGENNPESDPFLVCILPACWFKPLSSLMWILPCFPNWFLALTFVSPIWPTYSKNSSKQSGSFNIESHHIISLLKTPSNSLFHLE